MLLKNSTILALVGSDALGFTGALRDLHGIQKLARKPDGDLVLSDSGTPATELVPYKFAPNARTKLALILAKLAPLAMAIEEERKDMVREFRTKARTAAADANKAAQDEARAAAANGTAVPLPTPVSAELVESNPVWPEFMKELNDLVNAEQDVERFPELTIGELRVDDNLIPAPVIAALVPIVKLD